MRVVIVLPTYNERDNIGPLLDALRAQGSRMAHELHILVCDDTSPDGTADVARAVQLRDPRVHLSLGQRAGLGAAYVRGMRAALSELAADAIVQMDADFSHDPADVPRLLAALESGADLVVGSRYVRGGRIPDNWSVLRRANSRWGNRVARYLVGLHPIRDCTSGFRAIRASLIARIAVEDIRAQGYAFLVALLYEAKVRGARITEIPIVFADRTRGASKLGPREVLEFMANALWLRFRGWANVRRFLAIGACGVGVNLGTFALMLAAGIDKYVASPISTGLSILLNHALYRVWTLHGRAAGEATFVRSRTFNAISVAALAASYGTFVALSLAFPRIPPILHQLAAVVPATLVNYFGNAYWTSVKRTRGN
jgi:dolichol-phosphate mannosyltransferase